MEVVTFPILLKVKIELCCVLVNFSVICGPANFEIGKDECRNISFTFPLTCMSPIQRTLYTFHKSSLVLFLANLSLTVILLRHKSFGK